MHDHFVVIQPAFQLVVTTSQVIYPNGSIYENHATLVGRLLGIGDSFFSVPPRSANRLALSFAISASKPILIGAVFSETPVSLLASLRRSLSILSVVLICINMHHVCSAVKSLGGDNIEFSCPAAFTDPHGLIGDNCNDLLG